MLRASTMLTPTLALKKSEIIKDKKIPLCKWICQRFKLNRTIALNAHIQLKHDSPQTQRFLPRGSLFSPPLHLHLPLANPIISVSTEKKPQTTNQQTQWHHRIFVGVKHKALFSVCKALNSSAQKYLGGEHSGAESSGTLSLALS